MKALAVSAILLCTSAAVHADALVAKGAKTTLSVEYVYESIGKKQDRNDLHEWRVNRTAKVTANLTAEAAMALPAMHTTEPAQTADLQRTQERAASAQQKMAPTMADIQKLMAKCGDDEACMTREVQHYGMNMQMTPELKSAKQDVQALQSQGTSRYQLWSASAQSGTYSIDEKWHNVVADPLCMPTLHCTRDETRKGAGELPLPPGTNKDPAAATGFALVEVDALKNTVVMRLPMPIMPLPYTQTITTNSPEEKSGVSQQLLSFATLGGKRWGDKPITVTLKGDDLRQLSGEQVIKLIGEGGEGGELKIRWRFMPLR